MKINFVRPQERDLRFALGDLEALVVKQLWNTGKPLSVREFHARLSRNRPLAVTTIATILDRLYRKGMVSRRLVREGGPHYLYSAKLSEEEFKHRVVNNVMDGLLKTFNDVTVAYLANMMTDENRGKTDLAHLRKYLDRLRPKGAK